MIEITTQLNTREQKTPIYNLLWNKLTKELKRKLTHFYLYSYNETFLKASKRLGELANSYSLNYEYQKDKWLIKIWIYE